MQATEPIIEFAKVNKWYGQFHVLRDVDLNVAKGERIVICGPSGSGKSTLIRCINRLEEHQQGTLKVDGVELTDDVKAIEAIRKEVGMVFQQFNLFPHLTVLQNLTLAPMWAAAIRTEQEQPGCIFGDLVGFVHLQQFTDAPEDEVCVGNKAFAAVGLL